MTRRGLLLLFPGCLAALAPAARAQKPDAVTAASPEGGQRVRTTESVDGAALRQKHVERLRADRSPVTVLRGAGALELGRRLCEAVVPRVPAGTPVLLKPNLGGFDWFKNPGKSGGDDGVRGRITDPEFVRGVIQCLKARGLGDVTVADGWSASHADWLKLARVSGYEAMTRAEGVPLVALNDDGVFDVEGDRPAQPFAVTGMEKTTVPTLLMPRILARTLERGLFISLPKIKAHRFAVISMAVKGMQGAAMYADSWPAYKQRGRTHRELNPYLAAKKKGLPEDRAAYVKALETFAERMADILEVEAPDVVLAEGAPAMMGDGFQELVPVAETVAIGGTNAVAVDVAGARLLGLWDNAELAAQLGGHRTSPLIEAAARRIGLDPAKIALTGDGAAVVAAGRPTRFSAMAPFKLGEEPRPVAHAAALRGGELVLDGKDDEPAWRAAPEVVFETDYRGDKTGIVTRVRFLWSRAGLHAFFTLEGAGLFTDESQPAAVEREGLYKEDCVEIFLVPDEKVLDQYREIELGPAGHFFDLDLDRARKKSDAGWSSGARIATTRDAVRHRATIEVSLTAPDLVARLAAGARFPLGLYRMEGKAPRRYLAWSPPRTPKPKFHVPEAFGTLILD